MLATADYEENGANHVTDIQDIGCHSVQYFLPIAPQNRMGKRECERIQRVSQYIWHQRNVGRCRKQSLTMRSQACICLDLEGFSAAADICKLKMMSEATLSFPVHLAAKHKLLF